MDEHNMRERTMRRSAWIALLGALVVTAPVRGGTKEELARQVSEMKIESRPVTARRFQTASGQTGASAQSADTIFFEAYNDLVQGNTDLAIQGFTAYIASFPKSEKADDAQYYIGEAYYNDGKFAQAIAAFTRVLNDYPAGDRTASALYKRAMAEKQI